MTDQRLAAVLADTRPVLLDFDGPITHLFIDGRNRMVADRMREALGLELHPPPEIFETDDPLAVLRWSWTHAPDDVQHAVEAASERGEVEAVEKTEPTPGSAEFLQACRDSGRPVVIVSNNNEQAIRAYLDRFGLAQLVFGVVARTPGRPDLMKPHPDAVQRALDLLGSSPEECCMVGDSVTDIAVCNITGVRSIGYAKNPVRGRELADAGADAVVDSIADLALAVTNQKKSDPTQPKSATNSGSIRTLSQSILALMKRLHAARRSITKNLQSRRAVAAILVGIFATATLLALVSQVNVQGRHVAQNAFDANRGSGGPGESVPLTPRYEITGQDPNDFIHLDFVLQSLDVNSGILNATVTAYLDIDEFVSQYPNETPPTSTTVSITGSFSIAAFTAPLGKLGDAESGRPVPVAFEVWGESRAFPLDAYGSNNFVFLAESGTGLPSVSVTMSPALSTYQVEAAISQTPYVCFLLTRRPTQSIWVSLMGLCPAILLIAMMIAASSRFDHPTRVEAIGVGAGFLAILPLRQVLVPSEIQSLTRLDYVLGLELLAFLCFLAYLYLRDASHIQDDGIHGDAEKH